MKEGEILYQGTPKETITLSHCKLYTGSKSGYLDREDQQAMIHYL